MSAWIPLLSGFIGAVSAYLVARVTLRGQREGHQSSPYGELADRVVVLEQNDRRKSELIASQTRRIRLLEEDTEVLVDVVAEQHDWQDQGAAPPPPKITTRALGILRRHREERARLTTVEPVTD